MRTIAKTHLKNKSTIIIIALAFGLTSTPIAQPTPQPIESRAILWPVIVHNETRIIEVSYA